MYIIMTFLLIHVSQVLTVTMPIAFFVVHFLTARDKVDFTQAILGAAFLSVCMYVCLHNISC